MPSSSYIYPSLDNSIVQNPPGLLFSSVDKYQKNKWAALDFWD